MQNTDSDHFESEDDFVQSLRIDWLSEAQIRTIDTVVRVMSYMPGPPNGPERRDYNDLVDILKELGEQPARTPNFDDYVDFHVSYLELGGQIASVAESLIGYGFKSLKWTQRHKLLKKILDKAVISGNNANADGEPDEGGGENGYDVIDEETDWSNYNDDLDMDQQGQDFWNQF